ncbi:hypothetical protein [Brevibacillus laterosporus]|uniref:hypothetical protein n=1 Tax=Brevibacillus laterosporus TaxID=1465 RepID=UPI003D1FDDD6
MFNQADAPKTWTFEGWNGTEWIVLDSQKNIRSWEPLVKKEFIFNNTTPYIKYRINIVVTNGFQITGISEMEMMNTMLLLNQNQNQILIQNQLQTQQETHS